MTVVIHSLHHVMKASTVWDISLSGYQSSSASRFFRNVRTGFQMSLNSADFFFIVYVNFSRTWHNSSSSQRPVKLLLTKHKSVISFSLLLGIQSFRIRLRIQSTGQSGTGFMTSFRISGQSADNEIRGLFDIKFNADIRNIWIHLIPSVQTNISFHNPIILNQSEMGIYC